MVSNAQIGELIVGAYHKPITDAEVVSYNQRSKEQGEQMETDVLAIASSDGTQTVYACQVITHLDGEAYSGTPATNRWADYGNDSYQHSLEKLETKFQSDYEYVTMIFDDADQYVFQLWAPYLHEGYLTDGLEKLSADFKTERGEPIELLINEEYTKRVRQLQSLVSDGTKDYGEPAFRFVQIIEQLR